MNTNNLHYFNKYVLFKNDSTILLNESIAIIVLIKNNNCSSNRNNAKIRFHIMEFTKRIRKNVHLEKLQWCITFFVKNIKRYWKDANGEAIK